jgi:hypothetical protein
MSLTMVALAVSLLTLPRANPGLPQKEAPAANPRIDLFWSDYELLRRKLPSGGRNAVEREVQTILGEAGISVRFQEGSPEDNGARGPLAIRIILMRHGAHTLGLSPGAMGANVVESRTVYAFFPVILQIVGEDVESNNKILHDARKGRVFARALARVLAHEIVHAIDPEIPHGPQGSVMSANLRRELLLDHRLSFHESTTRQLLESLAVTSEQQAQRP